MILPLDLRAATTELRHELEEVFARFLSSGSYVLGPEVSSFEQEYAEYCRADFCVGVSSGLDALQLSLLAAGIGPGDEVIVASNTYIATWLAVTHAGARIVPVEPDSPTHNMDPKRIAEKITPLTKAILATNLYGLPVDYDAIAQVADAAGLIFLVDNAQASGAKYKGRPVGGIADLECHSFYPTKNLGALGEAGAVTTLNSDFADQIRILRNYGSRSRYHHEVPGFNSRLDELQAAVLRVKLRRLDQWNARRREIASSYGDLLSHHSNLILPLEPDWATSVWHLYVVRVSHRERVQEQMKQAGVGCLVHYPVPPHRSVAYQQELFDDEQYPHANALAKSVLSIPIGPHLSHRDAETVASTLLRCIETAGEPSVGGRQASSGQSQSEAA